MTSIIRLLSATLIGIAALTFTSCGPKEDDRAKYVAVGTLGIIYHSTDAVSWEKAEFGVQTTLSAVAWDGTAFVAVGEAGAYFRSRDGRVWTMHTASPAVSIRGVAENGGKLIAVGESGQIFCSFDHGKTFSSSHPWDLTANYRGIVWTGSLFCAALDDGSIAISPDGIAWTNHLFIGGATSLHDIAAGGGRIIVVKGGLGECRIWDAADPEDAWTPNAVGKSDTMVRIADNGSILVLVGFYYNGSQIGFVLTASHDHLETWTERWTAPDQVHCPQAIAWDGSRFIVGGQEGMILISNADATSWTLGSVGLTDGTILDIACR